MGEVSSLTLTDLTAKSMEAESLLQELDSGCADVADQITCAWLCRLLAAAKRANAVEFPIGPRLGRTLSRGFGL